jgi:hypothetical protein
MMDMEYFDATVSFAIEHAEWKPDERHDPDSWRIVEQPATLRI